ncbi:hypothetical protein AB0L37_03840, partial [Streptomyces sp. NPDC052225]
MTGTERLPLPLQTGGERWSTARAERTVLGVVHNVTSATRLLDLLTAFEGDRRIQTVFTCTGSSVLDAGTEAFLHTRGIPFIPWHEATRREFDLAVATNRGGNLHHLHAPLIGTPHGAGYNKQLN